MSDNSQRRRKPRNSTERRVIRLQVKDGLGNPRWITSDLLDSSDTGLGVSLVSPIPSGSKILVRGGANSQASDNERPARVMWCVERTDGTFRAGLEFLEANAGDAEGQSWTSAHPDDQDYYEVMQLSPNADQETIARVYRLLAQRYHPDNPTTGNGEMFMRISDAHNVLSDPVQRARYDALYRESKKLQWKIFEHSRDTTGPEAERRKRRGILELLYEKTIQDPERANITIFEAEDLLGCPREHLQAALWYLKGKGFIQRSDNGRYSITVEGFEEAEKNLPESTREVKALGPASELETPEWAGAKR